MGSKLQVLSVCKTPARCFIFFSPGGSEGKKKKICGVSQDGWGLSHKTPRCVACETAAVGPP